MSRDTKVERLSLPKVPEGWNAETQRGVFHGFTPSYFPFDQAVSAFQKAARRGFYDDAIQWSLELYGAGKARRTNIWNRHLVVAVEDIGPADPTVLPTVLHLRESGTAKDLALSAYILATAKKCRLNDWSAVVRCHNITPEPSAIEGCERELVVALKAKDVGKCIGLCNALTSTKQKIRRGRTTNAQALIWSAFRAVIGEDDYLLMVEKLALSPNWRWKGSSRLLQFHVVDLWIYDAWPKSVECRVPVLEGKLGDDKIMGVPDYALDKHTKEGKKMGRGIRHFFEEGSVLTNECDEWCELSDQMRELCVKELED